MVGQFLCHLEGFHKIKSIYNKISFHIEYASYVYVLRSHLSTVRVYASQSFLKNKFFELSEKDWFFEVGFW